MSNPADDVKTISVLIVDDLALMRTGMQLVLNRSPDIRVIGQAANGKEAIAAANELRPDVILLDVAMPDMDGIEAAQTIMAANPNAKIIMLTQRDAEADILASLAAGASGYCLKDVEPERLYTAIRSVKAGDAWIDATIAARVLKQFAAKSSSEHPSTQNRPNEVITPRSTAALSSDSTHELLSARELEVLKLIVEGCSNKEIADRLVISLGTAKTHVYNILNKLAVDKRTEAAVVAMRQGLI